MSQQISSFYFFFSFSFFLSSFSLGWHLPKSPPPLAVRSTALHCSHYPHFCLHLILLLYSLSVPWSHYRCSSGSTDGTISLLSLCSRLRAVSPYLSRIPRLTLLASSFFQLAFILPPHILLTQSTLSPSTWSAPLASYYLPSHLQPFTLYPLTLLFPINSDFCAFIFRPSLS